MKRLLKWACWLTAAVGLGCAGANADWHEFGVNGRAILCVPHSDMDPYLLSYNSESKNLQLRSGWTPGFGFLFDEAQIKNDLGQFHVAREFDGHPYANKLSGSVGFLDSSDQFRYGPSMRARNVEEIWYSTGVCKKPVLTSVGGDSYRVQCSGGDDYASIWNRRPNSSAKMPNPDSFVLATCRYEKINIGKYAGTVMRTCSRVLVVNEFILDYEFQESNLGLIPAMDAMLAGKITEWRMNCAEDR